MFFQFGAETLAGTPVEKENVENLIIEFWNSQYISALAGIVWDLAKDKNTNLPEQFGEFLVGDAHAPATYYVLTNDSFMGKIH